MSYESDALRSIYLLFHYGTKAEILDGIGFAEAAIPDAALNFPTATVEAFRKNGTQKRALDVGCAVGRSSFELSKRVDEVIGIDFSGSFVDVANRIRNGEPVEYSRFNEAHLKEPLEVRLADECQTSKVSFEQGDAMNLRADLGTFDWVHAANLLCRLPEPELFLNRLPELVNPGGQLVMATPCTWLEEFTSLQNQPTGPTLDFLHDHLDEPFEFIEVKEIPFVIREHVRKFQMSTSQTSLWKRRDC